MWYWVCVDWFEGKVEEGVEFGSNLLGHCLAFVYFVGSCVERGVAEGAFG